MSTGVSTRHAGVRAPHHLQASSYTSWVNSAVRFQENCFARLRARSRSGSKFAGDSAIDASVFANATPSCASINNAPSPATSIIAGSRDVTTIAPHCIASRTGNPKPSYNDGYTTALRGGVQLWQVVIGNRPEKPQAGFGQQRWKIRPRASGDHEIDIVGVANFAPRVDQGRDVLARFQRADEQEVRLGGRRPDDRAKMLGGRQRHRYYSIGRQVEAIDRCAADRLGRGNDDRGNLQAQKHRGAPADARGVRLPGAIEPGGEVVNGHHAGPRRDVRHRKISTMKHIRTMTRHFLMNSARPPTAVPKRMRRFALEQVGRGLGGHREIAIGDQPVLVFGKASRQGARQFGCVARDSSCRYCEWSRVEGDNHR